MNITLLKSFKRCNNCKQYIHLRIITDFYLIINTKAFGETENTDRNNRDVEENSYRSTGARADIDLYSPGYNNYFGSNSKDNLEETEGTYR